MDEILMELELNWGSEPPTEEEMERMAMEAEMVDPYANVDRFMFSSS